MRACDYFRENSPNTINRYYKPKSTESYLEKELYHIHKNDHREIGIDNIGIYIIIDKDETLTKYLYFFEFRRLDISHEKAERKNRHH